MSSNVPPAGARRRHFANRIQIGQYFERHRDHSIWQVRQVWRTDRLTQMVRADTGDQATVRFTELNDKWTQRTDA